MFLARVVGVVWATVKWPELDGFKLLLVRPYSLDALRGRGKPTTDPVVVADTYGAGPGEDVIIAYGHAARVAVEPALAEGVKPSTPVDAAVVAIVDRFFVEPELAGLARQ
jgi:ethanolamine utilization protein EutN